MVAEKKLGKPNLSRIRGFILSVVMVFDLNRDNKDNKIQYYK